jgi:hypothetical protein
MYFLRASLSVIVLSIFFGATCAQDYDPESSIIPTATAPPYTMTAHRPGCTVTIGGIEKDTCIYFSTIQDSQTTAPPHTMTTHRPGCMVTTSGTVKNTCIFFSTIEDSQTTAPPRKSPGTIPEAVNCYTTRVINTCLRGALLAHTPCLTTLTAHEGHVVVVDCGDGFESGYPPTMTAPTTVCIENRCFDVIGTFGSPASAAATPTQTQSKDEL